jgi:hypothetical protein
LLGRRCFPHTGIFQQDLAEWHPRKNTYREAAKSFGKSRKGEYKLCGGGIPKVARGADLVFVARSRQVNVIDCGSTAYCYLPD